jgi:hypothetical protein
MLSAMGSIRARRGLFLFAAVAASVYAALGAVSLGDYPQDGGPALNALLHGNLHAFSAAKPAMGTFSLIVRLPFAGIAYLGGSPTELSIYRWGAVPCVVAFALLGVWLADIARSRGTGVLGQAAIVAVFVFNPFVSSALELGHPEELLTASFAVGAVVAAAQERTVLTIWLLGLALATKQWAVIAVLPVVVTLGTHRVRTIAASAAIAAALTLPAIIGSPTAFLANQLALAHEHFLEPSGQSWFYELAPRVTLHLPHGLIHRGPRLPAPVVGLLHPLIIGLAVAVAAILARRMRSRRRDLDLVFAAVGLVFLLRCTVDTETMAYFHAPLFAGLVAWDAMRGERLPLRGLAAAVVGYVVFDRLDGSVVGVDVSAYAYLATTVGLAIALAAALLITPRAGRASEARGARAAAGLGRPAERGAATAG